MSRDSYHFNRVTLTAKSHNEDSVRTLSTLYEHLQAQDIEITIEKDTAACMAIPDASCIPLTKLGEHSDLLIVVGGDGSILSCAAEAAQQAVPVVGINRGRLGFLADISPDDLPTLDAVLKGKYREEKRLLLDASLQKDDELYPIGTALNDVVVRGDLVHMLEFDVYINQQFVCNQRADGLIVSTPTGSTAYALSAGGPILHPGLEAIALVPLCAHKLNTRPIVISSDSMVDIVLHKASQPQTISISFDGQNLKDVAQGSEIHITRHASQLQLIHPQDYHYYETLKTKLHWERKAYANPHSNR